MSVKTSVAQNAPPNQQTNITISFVMRGERHTYWITELTPKCWLFTNLHNHKTAQFHSAETLWAFFAALCKHLQDKTTPNQAKAIQDFLSNAEQYFRTFSQIVNSKVSNYTRDGMQWQLRNAELAAGAAASRYAQFCAQGI